MSKNRHLIPVLITIGATALGGCDDAKTTGKDNKEVKADEGNKADPETDPPPKDGPEKQPPEQTIIHDGDRFPEAMGGAAVPVPFDPPPGELGAPEEAKLGAGDGAAPAAAAPAAAARASAAVAPSAAAPATRVAVALVHNHPAGEECKPLTEAEVSKALADLKGEK